MGLRITSATLALFLVGILAFSWLGGGPPALEGTWHSGTTTIHFDGSTATITAAKGEITTPYRIDRLDEVPTPVLHWSPYGKEPQTWAYRLDEDTLLFVGRNLAFNRQAPIQD